MTERDAFASWVAPLVDLMRLGQAHGQVTVDEVNAALDSPATNSELIEDLLAALSGMGIAILDEADGAPALETSIDGPAAPGSAAPAIRQLVRRGLARGYVTWAELLAALPPDQASDAMREDQIQTLLDLGIPVRDDGQED